MTADPTARARASARARARTEVVVVRPLAADDVDATSSLQASAPVSARLDVPAALGAGFLRRWQLAHLDSPHAVALVAERTTDVDDDAPEAPRPSTCGLLLAVRDARAHQQHLRSQHGSGLARAAGTASPANVRALAGWARHRGGPLVSAVTLLPTRGGAAARARRSGEGAEAAAGVVVVEAVVVDPVVRGTGVGRQLLEALAAQAAGTGVQRVEACVPWGSGAEGFFTACGWTASTTRPSPRGGFETRVHLDL